MRQQRPHRRREIGEVVRRCVDANRPFDLEQRSAARSSSPAAGGCRCSTGGWRWSPDSRSGAPALQRRRPTREPATCRAGYRRGRRAAWTVIRLNRSSFAWRAGVRRSAICRTLVKLAEVDQRIQGSALGRDRHVREPPVSRVPHRVAGSRQRRPRAFERPKRRGHVGADDLVVSSQSGDGRERHRVAEVRESAASPSPVRARPRNPRARAGVGRPSSWAMRIARSANAMEASYRPCRAASTADSIRAPTSSGDGPSGSRSSSAWPGSSMRGRPGAPAGE